jgi:hypothetical protein
MILMRFLFSRITPSSVLKVDRRFGGTLQFHLQGWIVRQIRNQHGTDLFSAEYTLLYAER